MGITDELDFLTTNMPGGEDDLSPAMEVAVSHYQELFDCTAGEALAKLRSHRSEIQSHYLLEEDGRVGSPLSPTKLSKAATYLVKLEDPLGDADAVRIAAGLDRAPDVMGGESDTGKADFARVDETAKIAILSYLAARGSAFRPTFVQITQAGKSLSSTCRAPFLGTDSTLPQFRLTHHAELIVPTQDEYPVWYFVYGMLADPDELSLILRLTSAPDYQPATVQGGMFLAERQLVDARYSYGPPPVIPGKAYLVSSPEAEAALRYSVTDRYEVVRCVITLDSENRDLTGLTFRYNP
ncbi:hypothetical protein GQ53DRAFT_741395 [Thozetella sp. PMI_491]|nr:hypothetical protein GQ53DRAFT_741395 [Thozetella sp. PMI_491]